MSAKQVIFTLAPARSGTVYLRALFQRNVRDCVTRHEPFFDWGNPTLFGPAIYDAYAGRLERVRQRLEKKRRYVERLPGALYFESSHAFLKSAYVAALDVFPQLRLIHLVREPMAVARSAAWREDWRRRLHAPFHYYRGDDGRRHFAWALTGCEPIFRQFDHTRLTLFQWYVLEWFELENRAMKFLRQNQLHDRCFTLHSPAELNVPGRLRAMFEFFGLQLLHPEVRLGGRKNRSLGYSRERAKLEEEEYDWLLERLPEEYLEIFAEPPYTAYPWAARLRLSRASR
jgi:hypothetical protein